MFAAVPHAKNLNATFFDNCLKINAIAIVSDSDRHLGKFQMGEHSFGLIGS
jgi:alanyl-tRNA synthetase